MANVQRTVETVVFPYSRKKDGEKFEDGVAWKVPGGVVVEMWGGENTYFFTSTFSQAGTVAARLVSTLVDNLDIPTLGWKKSRGPQGWKALDEDFRAICGEAAVEICRHCGEGDADRVADILHKMESQG